MERGEIYDLLIIASAETPSSYWRMQQITDYLLERLVEVQEVEVFAASQAEVAELEAAKNAKR